MATSIGHGLAGMALARVSGTPMTKANWHWYLFAAFAAGAPDLDFIPGLWAGAANRFHQMGSHSLFAAVAFGVLAGALLRVPNGRPRDVGLWATMLYASHLLLDWLTLDTRAPYGIPLLWPFSDRHFIAPFSVFLNIRHGTENGGAANFFAELLSLHNLGAVALEVLLLTPLLILAARRGKRRVRKAEGASSRRISARW